MESPRRLAFILDGWYLLLLDRYNKINKNPMGIDNLKTPSVVTWE
jgi:hypothetical protein